MGRRDAAAEEEETTVANKQTCIDCCLIGYCMDNVTVSEQHIITLYMKYLQSWMLRC